MKFMEILLEDKSQVYYNLLRHNENYSKNVNRQKEMLLWHKTRTYQKEVK
jgi:hypothetical protein